MPKVVHYRKKCIGCHMCCEYAPNCWFIDLHDGKAKLKFSQEKKNNIYVADVSEFDLEEHMQAARNCPTRIIQINSDDGTQIAP